MNYPKISFKGKTFNEFSNDINDLERHLLKMKEVLLKIKDGNFEYIYLLSIEKNYDKIYKNIIHYVKIYLKCQTILP